MGNASAGNSAGQATPPTPAAVIVVELDGRDRIEVDLSAAPVRVSFIGCSELIARLQTLHRSEGPDPRQWTLPAGEDHVSLLLREVILKSRGEWKFPYKDDELCHCRSIPTKTVDQAIVAGAHTPEAVTRQTSASSACGTCRPDVQNIINYRLGRSG